MFLNVLPKTSFHKASLSPVFLTFITYFFVYILLFGIFVHLAYILQNFAYQLPQFLYHTLIIFSNTFPFQKILTNNAKNYFQERGKLEFNYTKKTNNHLDFDYNFC